MTNAIRTVLILSVLNLVGCSGTKPPETYTDSVGKTTIIETDRESCTRSCNATYSRCMETEPAEQNSLNATGFHDTKGIGATADCRTDLRTCLQPCNMD